MSNKRRKPGDPRHRRERRSPSARQVIPAATLVEREQSVLMGAWSGPLPHPDDLARYNEIVPGFAERLLALHEQQQQIVEKQSEHRRELERRRLEANVWNEKAGLVCGLFLALMVLGVGAFEMSTGQQAGGIAIVSGDFVMVIGALIVGRVNTAREMRQKLRTLLGQDAEDA